MNWSVRSEYSSPLPGRGDSVHVWRFVRSSLEDGGFKVAVCDREQRSMIRAELFFNNAGKMLRADSIRVRRGAEKCFTQLNDPAKPALVEQTVIPADWLNRMPRQFPEPGVFEFSLKKKIGSTDFSARFELQETVISFAEALAAGMISDTNRSLAQGEELRQITVVRKLGERTEPFLRQLWTVGGDFWLYEEKKERRSWRISEI